MRSDLIARKFIAQRRNLGYDFGDEKLDRRKFRDRADEHYDRARCARVLQPERVSRGGREISIWILRNPLKSPDSDE
jgi:hypothetical protein